MRVVRYGVPIAQMLVDLGVAGAIGGIALAVFALASSETAYGRALDIAAAGAGVWTVAATVSCVLVYSTPEAAPRVSARPSGRGYGDFLTQNELGRSWLTTALVGAAVTVLCFAGAQTRTALVFVAAFIVIGWIPISEQGHAGDSSTHNYAGHLDLAARAVRRRLARRSARDRRRVPRRPHPALRRAAPVPRRSP